MIRRNHHISHNAKRAVLERQRYKCANVPRGGILNNYDCILWRHEGGIFDNSGYKFFRGEQYFHTNQRRSEYIDNVKAFCPNCYEVLIKSQDKLPPVLFKAPPNNYFNKNQQYPMQVDSGQQRKNNKWSNSNNSLCPMQVDSGQQRKNNNWNNNNWNNNNSTCPMNVGTGRQGMRNRKK